MTAILLQTALLAATAVGAGLLLVDPSRFVALRVGRLALAGLAGLFTLGALLSSVSFIGVPRPVVLALGYVLAAAGYAVAFRRPRAARASWWRELVVAAPIALLASTPALGALAGPTLCHDAVAIWYPKTVEAARDVTLEPETFRTQWPRHAHAEYPRGLAWLASVADPQGEADPRLVRIVSLAIVLAGACATAGWFARRGDLVGGVLASTLVLVLPEMIAQSHVGLADPAVGIAVLLVGLAMTSMRDGGGGLVLAAIGAAGAASTKQEGAVVWLLVAALVARRFTRTAAPNRSERVLAAAILLTVLPWWLGRSKSDPEVLAKWSMFFTDPLFIAARFAESITTLGLALRDPNQMLPELTYDPDSPMGVAWFALVCIPLVRFSRTRPVVAAPAFLLLISELAVYLVTPHPLSWQIWTTIGRLPLHWLPLLIVAAVAAVRPPARAA